MNRTHLVVLSALCVASAAMGGEIEDRLTAVQAQLGSVLSEARASSQVAALRAKADAAQVAYETEEAGTPGVAALDVQIDALRKQMLALAAERNDRLLANAPALEARRKALTDAEEELGKAMQGGDLGRALLKERNALLVEIEAKSGIVPRPAPLPMPESPAPKE